MKNKKPKILIVENTSSLVKTWVRKFRDLGFKVASAKNAGLAMQRALETRPDIVIVDLPKIESSAVKQIRKNKWAQAVPFLFLNNFKDEESFIGSVNGPDEYLPYNWSLKGVVDITSRKLKTLDASLV